MDSAVVVLLLPALTCTTVARLWRVVFPPVNMSVRTTEAEMWMEVGVASLRPWMVMFMKAALLSPSWL